MNNQLQAFARQTLKDGLDRLPAGWQRKFALMYGRQGGKRSVADTEAMSIYDVVDEIPGDKLDWAMEQVENSLRKLDRRHRFDRYEHAGTAPQ